MFKTLLATGAALVALPVIAQTGNPTTNTPAGGTTTPNSVAIGGQANTTSQVPVSTTTNDHSEHDNVQSTTNTGAYTQVNGGVSTSSNGTPGMNADASTPTSVANGSMDGRNAMNNGAANSQSNPNMTGNANAGADATMRTQSGAYTGVGGPVEGARAYPACSRTVTDSCVQRGGR